MKDFARDIDFGIVTRSPAYSQSNKLAEAAVKIANKVLSALRPVVALMNYRAVSAKGGYSPSQLMFNRQIRTKIPSINLSNKAINRDDLENMRRRDSMKKNFDHANELVI